MRNALRTALVGSVAAGTLLACGTAHATPAGPGVTARVISQTTVGGTDYVVREITVPPGQSTGWHYHDGPLYGLVRQGTLTHYDSSCAQDGEYRTGGVIREPAGADHVHIGVNEGDKALVLDVLYVLPHGAPLSVDAPNPGCSFE